jgi:hypothetical protein
MDVYNTTSKLTLAAWKIHDRVSLPDEHMTCLQYIPRVFLKPLSKRFVIYEMFRQFPQY